MSPDLPQRYAFVADLNSAREKVVSRINEMQRALEFLASTKAARTEIDMVMQSNTNLSQRMDVLESRVSQMADQLARLRDSFRQPEKTPDDLAIALILDGALGNEAHP